MAFAGLGNRPVDGETLSCSLHPINSNCNRIKHLGDGDMGHECERVLPRRPCDLNASQLLRTGEKEISPRRVLLRIAHLCVGTSE
ncbi:unannotated protein [freshwater metagenome]|uniref:Unannotated protein n=1 Tax=freshwater metagenome TaxID=449393 RepID=A0A6J6DWB7_9ZZZZ